MTLTSADVIAQVVDTGRYPLAEPHSAAWSAAVAAIREDLAGDGCSVLADFIRPQLFDTLRAQGEAAAPDAHYARRR